VVAERWLGIQLGPLPALAALLAVLAGLWMRRRRGEKPPSARAVLEDLPVTAAGCLVFLISSPLVWLHYLILALPAVILLLGTRPRRQWLTIAAFTAISIDPYAELFGLADPVGQVPVVIGGLATLFALILAEIAAPPRNQMARQVEMTARAG
jgi:hypothetical protein